MKDKYLPVDLFNKLIKPDEALTFSYTSPFPGLIIPEKKGLFMVWHGTPPVIGVSSICGTTYTCRLDTADSLPLNWDAHSIWVGSTTILEVKPVDVEFHWSSGLPGFIQAEAPQKVIDIVHNATKSITKNERT